MTHCDCNSSNKGADSRDKRAALHAALTTMAAGFGDNLRPHIARLVADYRPPYGTHGPHSGSIAADAMIMSPALGPLVPSPDGCPTVTNSWASICQFACDGHALPPFWSSAPASPQAAPDRLKQLGSYADLVVALRMLRSGGAVAAPPAEQTPAVAAGVFTASYPTPFNHIGFEVRWELPMQFATQFNGRFVTNGQIAMFGSAPTDRDITVTGLGSYGARSGYLYFPPGYLCDAFEEVGALSDSLNPAAQVPNTVTFTVPPAVGANLSITFAALVPGSAALARWMNALAYRLRFDTVLETFVRGAA